MDELASQMTTLTMDDPQRAKVVKEIESLSDLLKVVNFLRAHAEPVGVAQVRGLPSCTFLTISAGIPDKTYCFGKI